MWGDFGPSVKFFNLTSLSARYVFDMPRPHDTPCTCFEKLNGGAFVI
jgi:hypothetical protein